LPEAAYSGRLIVGFETSWFTPCGTGYGWWLSGPFDDVARFISAHPDTAYPRGWRNARLLV